MKKGSYIILISTSLAIVVFFNEESIVFAEIDRDGETLVLRKTEDSLESFKVNLFKNIEKYARIIKSSYFILAIIVLFGIVVLFNASPKEFFLNTITIRGPPA